jgi:hypothetical protein
LHNYTTVDHPRSCKIKITFLVNCTQDFHFEPNPSERLTYTGFWRGAGAATLSTQEAVVGC